MPVIKADFQATKVLSSPVSFTWFADKPLLTEEEVAREVYSVALARGLDQLAAVLDLMCIRQEANFWSPANKKDPSSFNYDHDSESDDGRSVSYHQQQNGRAGDTLPPGDPDNWWGPMSCRMNLRCQSNTFLERLSDDYGLAANNSVRAGQFIQAVQGSAFPDAYAKHWTYCWNLLDRALAETGGVVPEIDPTKPSQGLPVPDLVPDPGWRGDPVWLPKVLAAFGVDVTTYTDANGILWDQRGHGDFGSIPYVVWHHTGSVNETDEGIAHHPSLGLAANMLIHPDGHVVLTGSGIAWHAGIGAYPGVPEDGINQLSIGIECAYGPDPQGNYTIRWPDAQMNAMIRVGAAISWFLGGESGLCPASHQIGHKEWAGADNPLGINKQGKPDPGNLDMNWFRDQIRARAALGPSGTGEDDWMTNPTALQLLQDIHRETVTQQSPSRSFMAEDGKLIDSPLGIEWNTDGNAWTLVLTEGYWNDAPLAVRVVEDIAENGVRQTSWAGSADKDSTVKFNQWLRDFGQAYCQGLVRRKKQWETLVDSVTALAAHLEVPDGN